MSMVKVMKIDEWLEKKSIEKDAIIFKDQNWTFSHLKKLITKTSLFLQNECQLKVGDRFCYYGTNNPEQIVLLFAASKIGAIMFPINWRLANLQLIGNIIAPIFEAAKSSTICSGLLVP